MARRSKQRHICSMGTKRVEKNMRPARAKMSFLSVGFTVSVLGLGALLASPADAQSNKKRAYSDQGSAVSDQGRSGGVTAWPKNTPPGNVVCWTPCNQPNAIVMGADPDPFIRSQILRDAEGFFGGGGR
jgi:hypothetical protein